MGWLLLPFMLFPGENSRCSCGKSVEGAWGGDHGFVVGEDAVAVGGDGYGNEGGFVGDLLGEPDDVEEAVFLFACVLEVVGQGGAEECFLVFADSDDEPVVAYLVGVFHELHEAEAHIGFGAWLFGGHGIDVEA